MMSRGDIARLGNNPAAAFSGNQLDQYGLKLPTLWRDRTGLRVVSGLVYAD